MLADHEVFVIDQDPAVADVFATMDVEFIPGSGTSAEVLARAGVKHAAFLVACTGLDEVNIVACAIANKIGSPETICLVSRADFLGASPESGLEQFGIDRVLWPEAQLAADIEQVVIAPGAIDAEVFAGGIVRLLDTGSRRIPPWWRACQRPASASRLADRRGEARRQAFVPRGTTQLAEGDKIIIMGTPEAMREVAALVRPGETRDTRR